MPQSLRFREVQWQPTFLFGRYTAQVKINPGFGSTTETASVVFWVIPWKIILMVFIILVLIIGGVRWIAKNVSLVRKK
jgi:cytochrome c-type biogenesis protein CcmH/NrfF